MRHKDLGYLACYYSTNWTTYKQLSDDFKKGLCQICSKRIPVEPWPCKQGGDFPDDWNIFVDISMCHELILVCDTCLEKKKVVVEQNFAKRNCTDCNKLAPEGKNIADLILIGWNFCSEFVRPAPGEKHVETFILKCDDCNKKFFDECKYTLDKGLCLGCKKEAPPKPWILDLSIELLDGMDDWQVYWDHLDQPIYILCKECEKKVEV